MMSSSPCCLVDLDSDSLNERLELLPALKSVNGQHGICYGVAEICGNIRTIKGRVCPGMNDIKYKALLETLKKDILSGKYSAQNPFPSIRALIRRYGVSKTTVQRALDELVHQGLVSRKQGRGTFVTGRSSSRLIGLVIPGIAYSSEFFQLIVSELIQQAKRHDYTIVMDGVWSPKSSDSGHEAVEVAARLIKRRVAGIIYQPLEYTENSETINRRVLSAFSRAQIPVVLLDGDIVPGPARSEFDLVSIDNVAAGEELAAHLIGRGARNIRFLMRANWVKNVKNRARGVRNGILSHGLPWREKYVVMADPTDGTAIRKLMRCSPHPDAIVCENDIIAANLMKTLGSLGYVVPDDVMVAGFDDVQVARLSSPGITTVRQPCEGIAREAFDRLVLRMDDRALMPVQVLLPHALVSRGSTTGVRRRGAGKPRGPSSGNRLAKTKGKPAT